MMTNLCPCWSVVRWREESSGPAVSGCARGSRVSGEAPPVRPGRKCRLMNRFPAVARSSVLAVTRQRWRVTTQIRRVADGVDQGLRA